MEMSLRTGAADRAGLTLLEVLIALGVFLLGAVGIVSLFVAAGVLHTDATQRRKAAFIAEEVLAEVSGMRLREVFARTALRADLDVGDQAALAGAVTADSTATHWEEAANFDEYPLHELFDITDDTADMPPDRTSGPILIDSEWIWYEDLDEDDGRFLNCSRHMWGTEEAWHQAPLAHVLQPRTWYYVLRDDLDAADPDETGYGSIPVDGDPTAAPAAPGSGYVVVDREWIRYSSPASDGFNFTNESQDRAVGESTGSTHRAGTPVTVAREHPDYVGAYYALQFYPVNATGSEARVTVSVAYGTAANLRRAFFFDTVYVPTKY